MMNALIAATEAPATAGWMQRWLDVAEPWETWWLLLGLLVSLLAPLGDLAVSMMKRQVGVKDTGTIIRGHGGALDRVDSVLWAGVLVYYYVRWVVAQV